MPGETPLEKSPETPSGQSLQKSLTFLRELGEHNSLDWMHDNKTQYLEAKAEFAAFIQETIALLTPHDPAVSGLNAEDLMFRLNRDTRFSKDKSPYRTAFRAHISPAGRKPIPAGYYFSLSPGESFLGGGVFAAQLPTATTMVRDYLVGHPAQFQRIIESPDFASRFTIEGDKLKRVPRGYDPEHPLAEYLKHKSWDIEYHVSDEALTEGGAPFVADTFLAMKPLNDYLNTALTGFQMPQR